MEWDTTLEKLIESLKGSWAKLARCAQSPTRLLLTALCSVVLSPLTARCSLLTAHCSLLTAHCSLLTAHCSLLTVVLSINHACLSLTPLASSRYSPAEHNLQDVMVPADIDLGWALLTEIVQSSTADVVAPICAELDLPTLLANPPASAAFGGFVNAIRAHAGA